MGGSQKGDNWSLKSLIFIKIAVSQFFSEKPTKLREYIQNVRIDIRDLEIEPQAIHLST